jgi:hypothetical protein
MFERLLAPLLETLRPHFDLSKSRLETLAVLLVGLANCRTVNLSHLASQFPGAAKHSSNYRRLQRFFQFVELDGDVAARLIMRMLNLIGPTLLALDRTNWKLGSRDVNILMLAVVTLHIGWVSARRGCVSFRRSHLLTVMNGESGYAQPRLLHPAPVSQLLTFGRVSRPSWVC